MFKDLTGSRRSYAAVLTADKKGTSAIHNGGRSERLRDNHIFRDVNLITQTVEFDNKGSTDPRSRKVGVMLDLHLKKSWKSTWETKGFQLVECWCHITTK